MQKQKWVSLAAVVLTILLIVSGCGNGETKGNGGSEAGEKKIKVAFAQMANSVPYRIKQTNSIKEEGEKRGYEMLITDAQDNTAKQVSDVEDLIARKVDYIALTPREFEGLAPALQTAKKAGVPVILIDRVAKGEAGVDYVTNIAADYVWEGAQAAEWLVANTEGDLAIVELTGTVGASAAKDRSDGFHQVIGDHPRMQVIASQTADFSRSDAQKVMENIIQAKGKAINVVYAHNDEMAIGAALALREAGIVPGKDVHIIGIDGQVDAFEMIKAGDMSATVFSSPYYGPILFDTIEKLKNGEEVPTKIMLEGFLVDKSNVEEKMELAY